MSRRQEEPPQSMDPEDLLPAVCECGFEAESVDEMEGHDHPVYWFMMDDDSEPEGECWCCGAPAPKGDSPDVPEFCDDHDVDDYVEMQQAVEGDRGDAMRFKEEHVENIEDGEKTATRRVGE